MVGHRRHVRALVVTSALGALLVTGPGPATAPAAGAAPAGAPEVDPLQVTIATMAPSALPATGDIRITGTVTNRTDETWSSVRLYAFAGDELRDVPIEPMRNQRQLELAMATPSDEVVGERILDAGRPGEIESLPPGGSETYTIVLPPDAVEVTRAGVYWFGVHALGISGSTPDDDVADGRARTFLPYVPRRFEETPVTTSLVVPLTQPVRYAPDGSVDDVEGWSRALDPDGRLTRLLDFVDASDRPVTWLVDPALPDAVAHLARGNRPRSLGPSRPPGQSEGEADGQGAGDGGSDGPTDEPPSEDPTVQPEPEPLPEFAQTAATWLERLGETLAGDEVLALPYGNLDVPATLDHAPELLDLALAQRSTALTDLQVETTPAMTSPSGYLDTDTIRAATAGTRLLVTDRMFGSEPPAAVDADGHRLLVTSHGATQGSPGPGSPLTSVGIRQRLLAEAAVRVIKKDRRPLVAVLPLEWGLTDAAGFFEGLDAPWTDRAGLGAAESAAGTPTAMGVDELDYTRLQERRELDLPTIEEVRRLIDAGDTLQNVLVDNTEVGGTITEEALTGLSYFVRNGQAAGRLATTRSRDWVAGVLGGVEITASPGVTLASDTGEFVVTLSNRLDHRVAVSVRARSDDGIEVIAPEQIVLPPGGRETVFLEARATTNSVHNVELVVTDPSGNPLGSTDELPIRPTQVSGVIWIIMGTGAGLLFLAIVVRLVRRVRAARRGDPAAGRRSARVPADDDDATAPPVEVG